MKKKVLFFTYCISGGGAERTIRYILNNLDRERFEPVLCVVDPADSASGLIAADIPVHAIRTPLRPASLFLFFKLVSLIRRVKPDMVLAVMWGMNTIALAAGMFTKQETIICEQVITNEHVELHSFHRLRKFIMRMLYPKAKSVIAVSKAVKDGLISEFGLTEEQIKVIYNSSDVRWVAKKADEYQVPLKDYIVSCGRLQKQKNFSLLIDSVAYIRQNKGLDIPLVLVGDGPDRKELERYAAERSVRMTITGFMDNPFPWVQQAKVFAMTSIYEGLPLVIPEAMACKVPVVAVDCPGGTREIVIDGKTGLLIKEFTKEAVGAGIMRILADTALAQELSRNAYENVLQKFDVGQMVREYQDILR